MTDEDLVMERLTWDGSDEVAMLEWSHQREDGTVNRYQDVYTRDDTSRLPLDRLIEDFARPTLIHKHNFPNVVLRPFITQCGVRVESTEHLRELYRELASKHEASTPPVDKAKAHAFLERAKARLNVRSAEMQELHANKEERE